MVGNSVGGAVALRLALADPARIRTLTLVDSAGLGREVHPLLALDTLPILGELAIMISRMPGGDLGRTSMSTAMLFAQPSRVPAEFFTEQHALGRRPGQLEASTAMARALFDVTGQREVLLDQLPTLTMPTLVIWGGCDYVLPASQAQAAVDRLPHGRLALFADCGHLPHVECPDRFATVLSEWLAEHHELVLRRLHHGDTRTLHRTIGTARSSDPHRRALVDRQGRRRTAARRAATTGAPTPSAAGASSWSSSYRSGPVTRFWTWAAAPGCACRCCSARSAPRGRSSGSTPPRRCSRWPVPGSTEHGWDNVHLFAAPVAEAPIDCRRGRRPVLRGARRAAVPGRAGPRVRASAARGGGGRDRREVAAPVERGAASLGGRPARTVHQRLHRLRPAMAAAGRVRPRPAGHRAGRGRRIPGGRPRPRTARHAAPSSETEGDDGHHDRRHRPTARPNRPETARRWSGSPAAG